MLGFGGVSGYSDFDWLVPNRLAQGAYPGTHAGLFKVWDVVVYTAVEHQPRFKPPQGKFVYKVPLDDDIYRPVPPEVQVAVHRMGQSLAAHLRAGHKVLVTCRMGANRSGIVSAVTLMHLTGCSGAQAVETVKSRRRSGDIEALSNPIFERWLRTSGQR